MKTKELVRLALSSLILLLLCGGCGKANRIEAGITGYASTCIGGVEYYQFTSGVTVAYNPNGTVKTCN